MDIEFASYVLHFRRVLFTIKLLHKCFQILCTLLMPYWTSLCVLRRTCRQDYETLFPVVILSKHHHHHHIDLYIAYIYICMYKNSFLQTLPIKHDYTHIRCRNRFHNYNTCDITEKIIYVYHDCQRPGSVLTARTYEYNRKKNEIFCLFIQEF
jgi:hypothetical protein